jgi:hypothetical protein
MSVGLTIDWIRWAGMRQAVVAAIHAARSFLVVLSVEQLTKLLGQLLINA